MNYQKLIITGACVLMPAITWAELPANITTTDGQTYTGVSLVRTEPDGYLVNYEPVKNGMGMAKIKFSRLSIDQQKQAGYEPDKARDFEAKVAKATEDWQQAGIRWEQAAKAERQAQQTRDDQEEQLAIARMTALAQLKMAEANVGNSPQNNQDYNWSSLAGGGWGAGVFAIPEVQNNSGFRNEEFRNRGLNAVSFPNDGFRPSRQSNVGITPVSGFSPETRHLLR